MKAHFLYICVFSAGILFTGCSPSSEPPTDQGVSTANTTAAQSATAGDDVAASTQSLAFNLIRSDQQFHASETYQAGIGDIDGDGDLDLVLANSQENNSEVWLNDSAGHFNDSGQGLTMFGHGVALADFDGDGDLDAVIVCHQYYEDYHPSKYYLNNGDGTLVDSGLEFGDESLSANDANVVDINSDGFPDLHVVYYEANGVSDNVYLNDGSGHLIDSGLVLDENTIAWGDLDGDDDVDYFGKVWGEGYVVQLNQDGDFTPGWQYDDPQSNPGEIALVDFDGDGDLDALVTNGHNSVGGLPSKLFMNDGSGNFSLSDQILNGTKSAHLATGDLDNDGDVDVFVSTVGSPNEVWLNDGTGILVDSGLRLGNPNDLSVKASLADLDGDGDLDVIVGRLNGSPELWLNTTFWSD